MARATVDELKKILDTSLTDPQLAAFLRTAHTLVENELSGAGLFEGVLREIEMWLGAHFASIRDQRAQSEKIGDAQVAYQGKTDMKLDATLYGQQAVLLDSSGNLAKLGKKKALFQVAHEVPTA